MSEKNCKCLFYIFLSICSCTNISKASGTNDTTAEQSANNKQSRFKRVVHACSMFFDIFNIKRFPKPIDNSIAIEIQTARFNTSQSFIDFLRSKDPSLTVDGLHHNYLAALGFSKQTIQRVFQRDPALIDKIMAVSPQRAIVSPVFRVIKVKSERYRDKFDSSFGEIHVGWDLEALQANYVLDKDGILLAQRLEVPNFALQHTNVDTAYTNGVGAFQPRIATINPKFTTDQGVLVSHIAFIEKSQRWYSSKEVLIDEKLILPSFEPSGSDASR